jgi:threonine aldolase
MSEKIDLRSDTVTLPTENMRNAMRDAEVGDDVFREDPTILKLEKEVASLFHKESALFFPSGTMSNLAAILAWCDTRGSEIIVGDNSHIFLFEQSGASQFGGVAFRTIPNISDGTFDLTMLKTLIRDTDIHEPTTKLICIENTHNACGGKVMPLSFLDQLSQFSRGAKIPIHIDGARIWNALTKSNMSPDQLSPYFHSMTVCLSKGLGAPIGSLLIGEYGFIEKARRIRKALGGGMRQVGILGAAGLVAIEDFKLGIINDDHIKTQRLVEGIKKNNTLFQVRDAEHSNIVFISIYPVADEDDYELTRMMCDILKERNIYVSNWGPLLLRMVIHRNITLQDIDTVIKAFHEISDLFNYT